ncbi:MULTISPECIES: glucosaminidase domain-containing protein [unclassified Lentimicrobium]|uniref:glucosaminidase domain-containing protein n=1 Tax=unclassified Lentimicrobium TaxID=2677434 RepID=UPI001553F211|nr:MULTISPECIES: glucosaminidase domain-containing protein [unclassified Lentimicrobium]NPD47559.1 glucosaminidase domain-containing protein [Lentimicrobium sp. S6]NPD86350.1 glucosaminidase domain-containing protein [Lentimicrobium sp. L6]
MKLQKIISITIGMMLMMIAIANPPFRPENMGFTPNNYYSVFIMDQGKSEIDHLSAMLQFYNPKIKSDQANQMAKIYVEESIAEGVNHDIAFCQMILETGFLKYGGDVKSHQNNFCGLGATGNREAGEYFPDVRTGIRAHIQHLKAYASIENINHKSVDKRFRFVKRGSATTIYALQGKWATDPQYDQKLENLLERLFQFRYFYAIRDLETENLH